ncbi:MAG: hypothetical protein J3T61_10530 [Candidatus Brocadiales bacterium]|nr:hypothetical protein [Candidatus Bathyanammoxibius sp.]
MPKKNVAYEFDIALIDTANPGSFKANPTLAAGDFKVSIDNGALANLATLPVVSPASSIVIKIVLSQAEMNGDKILVQCIDAAGDEWNDVFIFIDASVVTVDDLVRSTTPANALDVTAAGNAGIDWGNIENKATVNDLSGTDIKLVDTTTTNTDMRGTDSAALASVATEARLAELDAANLPTDVAARATPAQVNTEVSDVLKTDTLALPGQGAPTATPTMESVLGWLYKTFRNKKTQTSTDWKLFDDAGAVVDSKATVSEVAGVATKEEISSGP